MSQNLSGPTGSYLAPGLGAPWTLYPLACVLGGGALYIVIDAWFPVGDPLQLLWIEVVWWALLALLWYFLVVRIPDRARVASVRSACPDAVLILGARLRRSAQSWIAESIRSSRIPRPRRMGTAIVATAADLQFWMGAANGSAPVAAVRWSDVRSISPVEATTIRLLLGPLQLPVEFRTVSSRRFGTVLLWGSDRDRVIAQLERLRAPAPASRSYSQDGIQ